MKPEKSISLFTLLLMISFASVNAVLFTPALPNITTYFNISTEAAQQTITWFLIAYAFGQLIYGPLANRFGRKPTLYAGIKLQIISSLMCAAAGMFHSYPTLIIGRFLLGLGSGVGLKMTFTLVNEFYSQKIAAQKTSYLMLAFAITPGLGVAIGGILNEHYGWMSCFYAGAIYGVILLILTTRLPETKPNLDKNALKLHHLMVAYSSQFKSLRLISGGLLMGGGTCFVYVFAALAPFIAINLLHMSSSAYGIANLLPSVGLATGSIVAAQLVKIYEQAFVMKTGIIIALGGGVMMLISVLLQLPALLILFIPMMICYFGMSFIFANASTIAMGSVTDKAHGAAVMSFINMGFATLIVLSLGLFPTQPLLMPIIFITISVAMLGLYKLVVR